MWDKNHRVSAASQKDSIRRRISELDLLEEQRLISPTDFLIRNNLNVEYRTFLHSDSVRWKQRSRFRWMAEGDGNTKFFHSIASARRRTNRITALCNGDQVVTDSASISNLLVKYFSELYSEVCFRRPNIHQLDFERISTEDVVDLETPFSSEEIERAVLGLPKDKAPGPDGFNGEFYQCFWDLLKNDVLNPCQSAFIRDRNILDSSLTAHELLDSFKKSSLPRFVLKIDFEKAFDPVDWKLVDYLFDRMGFGTRWKFWMSCISSPSYSVLSSGGWNLHLKRALNDSEAVEATGLINLLSGVALKNSADTLIWTPNKQGIPNYFLSFLACPASISRHIDKIKRRFLCHGTGNEFHYHLVRWDAVCRPKSLGGFRIRRTKEMGYALLLKWFWKLNSSSRALWKPMVAFKASGVLEIDGSLMAIVVISPPSGRPCFICSPLSAMPFGSLLKMAP
ncbi:uncharacterized protein [Aristolochia californica]|uniref:uncharacterized protein n=1 Tax=Aristolochia californica TaxID=171875 RepID=UPI0035D88439